MLSPSKSQSCLNPPEHDEFAGFILDEQRFIANHQREVRSSIPLGTTSQFQSKCRFPALLRKTSFCHEVASREPHRIAISGPGFAPNSALRHPTSLASKFLFRAQSVDAPQRPSSQLTETGSTHSSAVAHQPLDCLCGQFAYAHTIIPAAAPASIDAMWKLSREPEHLRKSHVVPEIAVAELTEDHRERLAWGPEPDRLR